MDGADRVAGVLAVSGASSVPGLSSAALDAIVPGLARVRAIDLAIVPGNRAPRGQAVIDAILGTVGRPMPRLQGGRWGQVHGWQNLCRRSLRLPSGETLGRRWVTACDVPDNVLFAERYPGVETVAFRAGLELHLLQFGLWALSWPVRWRLLPGLGWLGPVAGRVARWLEPFGSDRGGMLVEVTGETSDGRRVRRRWTLLAGSAHGPWIPAVPAAILAAKLAAGDLDRRGAMPCLGLFDLAVFAEAVGHLDIRSAIEEQALGPC